MPPHSERGLEALWYGSLSVVWELVIVGAWWLYFANSKNVKETYAITQASPPPLINHLGITGSPPPLPEKEGKAGMVSAVYGINQNRTKERNMSENKKFIIVAVIVFILPAIYCFKEAAFHEHTSSCVISSHQNREGEPSGGNSHPSKSDCVSHFIWFGGVLAVLGVGTIVNIVRKQD